MLNTTLIGLPLPRTQFDSPFEFEPPTYRSSNEISLVIAHDNLITVLHWVFRSSVDCSYWKILRFWIHKKSVRVMFLGSHTVFFIQHYSSFINISRPIYIVCIISKLQFAFINIRRRNMVLTFHFYYIRYWDYAQYAKTGYHDALRNLYAEYVRNT